MPQRTERLLPVVIGYDYAHVMGKAVIDEQENGPTIITITVHDEMLTHFLIENEPKAVSFSAIPVTNIREKREGT